MRLDKEKLWMTRNYSVRLYDEIEKMAIGYIYIYIGFEKSGI